MQSPHTTPPGKLQTALLSIVPATLVRAPELDQPPGADRVAVPHQRGEVDVERAVRLRAAEEHSHGAHGLEDAVRGRPRVLEEVEADLTRVGGDVGVQYRRDELDLGRMEWVRRRDGDGQQPSAGYKGEKKDFELEKTKDRTRSQISAEVGARKWDRDGWMGISYRRSRCRCHYH